MIEGHLPDESYERRQVGNGHHIVFHQPGPTNMSPGGVLPRNVTFQFNRRKSPRKILVLRRSRQGSASRILMKEERHSFHRLFQHERGKNMMLYVDVDPLIAQICCVVNIMMST